MNAKSLTEILKKAKKEHFHPSDIYIKAFENSDYLATEFIDAGCESLAVRLEDGQVLKISQEAPREKEPFDLPFEENEPVVVMLDSGNGWGEWEYTIYSWVQPFVKMGISKEDFELLKESWEMLGYHNVDAQKNQCAYHKGKPYLVDIHAVQKN